MNGVVSSFRYRRAQELRQEKVSQSVKQEENSQVASKTPGRCLETDFEASEKV